MEQKLRLVEYFTADNALVQHSLLVSDHRVNSLKINELIS
jgi:hypothetical protein